MFRIQSFDLARGFSVLFIPAVHTVMLFSTPDVYTTWFGYPLQFIAEGPGGQLFMLLMGLVFTFKPVHDTGAILLRASKIAAAGYALNCVKFVGPHAFGLLPANVLAALQLSPGLLGYWQLFSLGDILHFAALALVTIHFVYRQKNYQWFALVLVGVISISSPLLWDMQTGYSFIDDVLQVMGGQPPRVFFPFFPWMVYPLAGLVCGYWFQQDHIRFFKRLPVIGTSLLVMGAGIAYGMHEQTAAGFYRAPPGQTFAHLGVVLLAISAWRWIDRNLPDNKCFDVLNYSSRHITLIYVIQWTLIAWLLPVIGYQTLGLWPSVFLSAATTFFIYSMTYLMVSIQQVKHLRS